MSLVRIEVSAISALVFVVVTMSLLELPVKSLNTMDPML